MRQLYFSNYELPALVKDSLQFLREHEPEGGYFLGFSGGKDSIVTLELAKMAGVKFIAGYNFTGIDHPEVVRMIRRDYPEVRVLTPRQSFWSLLRKNPPPRFRMRWCCRYLKESETMGYKHLIMGIRAEESGARAKRGRINTYKGKTTFKPIFHWPEWAVWDFITSRGLVYPALYDEGFPRVGCMVCPALCGTSEAKRKLREKFQARYPLVFALHKKCVRYWWDNHARKHETSFENFYRHYWETG